jgi:hypothetical protein
MRDHDDDDDEVPQEDRQVRYELSLTASKSLFNTFSVQELQEAIENFLSRELDDDTVTAELEYIDD